MIAELGGRYASIIVGERDASIVLCEYKKDPEEAWVRKL